MFKFFKTKQNKQLNKVSEIINVNFSTLDSFEFLTFRDCLKCEMKIKCSNEKIYRIVSKTTEFGLVETEIFDSENRKLPNVNAFGQIKETEQISYFILDRIGNGEFKKMGFGHLMMQATIYLLSKYETLYNISFDHIEGTLGISGNDLPEESIPFYKSLDNVKFNETKHLHLRENTLNIQDREIFYLIA